MRKLISSFLFGLFYAFGLGVSQMNKPPKVLGFLNVLGNWDPTLLVVFTGAVLTYLVFYFWLIGSQVRNDIECRLAGKETIEPKMFIGSILFGIGWGMIGLCPGSAIMNIALGEASIWTFLVGMLCGIWGGKLYTLKQKHS